MHGPTPPRPPTPGVMAGDAFLFSGNRHESVPRALFLDARLTPLERNAWQVIRMQLAEDGLTAFPTYEQLRPFLASMPCTARASTETVARALTLLRLTRWLSLVRRRRDPINGRMAGNVYVLHDEPLTPFEAMQLDPEYLSLVSDALSHASKAIQRVGQYSLQEIHHDPMLRGRALPTRLQRLTERLGDQGWDGLVDDGVSEGAATGYPQTEPLHDSEGGDEVPLRNRAPPPSESETGGESAWDQALRNPKAVSTVRTIKALEERTVRRARDGTDATLRLPARFALLHTEQQAGALLALETLDADLQQAVLDEWQARCDSSTVRNPAGYLFGVVQKALRGEFKAWASQRATPPTSPPPSKPPASPPRRADPVVANEHIARLRKLLGLP
ncbi:hypothetical protein DIE11_17600 [Burkholderia sp. Bp9012]|nr:STY4528 family pathogenicity island replication protein [Burkholderia sp. Bp9012]RQR79206.1 hypothetical protein DIE11_17600 [Burkholderia sp. Bp9012]